MTAGIRVHRQWAALAVMFASVLALSGCGGRTVVTMQESTSITKGRELTDLQRAREAGVISAQEYEALRAVVMKRPN